MAVTSIAGWGALRLHARKDALTMSLVDVRHATLRIKERVLTATPEEIIARYAARWSIEVTLFDVKNLLGVGQARNRVPKAVQRTVPFGLLCHSLLIIWYARHGHATTDVAHRRTSAPWYRSKTGPSTLDMLTSLRRQIIAARFLPSSPRPATTEEILEVQQAWALAAA